MTNSKHGAYWVKSHGMTNTRIYRVWRDMKQRCNNPKCANYMNYGARGIRVCDEWNDDFITFYHWASTHGYKLGLSIDRVGNNGNYSPDNCRWVAKNMEAVRMRNDFIVKNHLPNVLNEVTA